MSTTYTYYNAFIPAMFLGDREVKFLVAFLKEHWLAQDEADGGVHFEVTESDDSDEYHRLSGHDKVPCDEWVHGEGRTLLHKLICAGKICLVYKDSFWSGGGYEDERECDPVAMAEEIPTLILREVLAKRLELE